MYNMFDNMKEDKIKEITDISDHTLIEVNMSVENKNDTFKRNQWVESEYYTVSPEALEKYKQKLENTLKESDVNTVAEFNEKVKETADGTLRRNIIEKLIAMWRKRLNLYG